MLECLLYPKLINTLGLSFDIAGIFIMFWYEVPLAIQSIDGGENEQTKPYRKKIKLGLILIMLGFGLQIISNYLPSPK